MFFFVVRRFGEKSLLTSHKHRWVSRVVSIVVVVVCSCVLSGSAVELHILRSVPFPGRMGVGKESEVCLVCAILGNVDGEGSRFSW